MSLRLRDGVSWCLCAGRAVFLDLNHDRFFCLPPERDAAFQRWVLEEERFAVGMLEPLCQCGLLVPDEEVGQPAAPARLVEATRDLADAPGNVAALRDIAGAVFAQHQATRLLRRMSLQAILAKSAPAPRNRPKGEAGARAQRLAAAFATAGMIVRSADRCLPRAIAMREQCHRAGLRPLLAFGVRRDPFAAHCWVQLDDAILIGDLEQVRLFTPILVVP